VYWSARELGPALDYAKWENFAKVIKRAMIACFVDRLFRQQCLFTDLFLRAVFRVKDCIQNIKAVVGNTGFAGVIFVNNSDTLPWHCKKSLSLIQYPWLRSP